MSAAPLEVVPTPSLQVGDIIWSHGMQLEALTRDSDGNGTATVALYALAVLALAVAHWFIVGSLPVGVVL